MIETEIQKDYETYFIIEEARDKNYKLRIMNDYIDCSGEYIHKNIDIFKNIRSKDLSRIIFITGFNKGRRVSLALKDANNSNKPKKIHLMQDNVYNFKPTE